MKKRYNALPAVAAAAAAPLVPVWVILLLGGLIILPIFVGGMAITIKIIQILFYTPVGNVPVWSLFVGGFIIIWIYKKVMGQKSRFDSYEYN